MEKYSFCENSKKKSEGGGWVRVGGGAGSGGVRSEIGVGEMGVARFGVGG